MNCGSRSARLVAWVILGVMLAAAGGVSAAGTGRPKGGSRATPPAPQTSAAPTAPTTPAALQGAAWVRVSYGQLLDESTVVRTGQSLASAVRDPAARGSVQPFIDQYVYLLQHAVEILRGPDALPYANVTDNYQPGAVQPAWVAIFRGGRVHAIADGKDHVRLFLLGDDPAAAYAQHYSVIRHCLNALAPRDGKPLQIEVYAYQHDYALSEMRLNTQPSQFSGTNFPAKTKEPDLAGLSGFFAQGATLEGAQLSQTEGLVLIGKRGEPATLAGEPVSLADLAVVYRAAFHAGDNAAFVSLDENPDPTKVTVNFGGFLEDTRIGSVVLQADKRFKTITSGVDPDSHEDLRDRTRQRIPEFASAAERDLASSGSGPAGGWAATRLWFYPDQAGVETDPDFQFAAITRPQFTADSERSRKRFLQPDGSAGNAGAFSPGIRQSMDHLNAHYADYVIVFPELRELGNVARLMAIVSWLKRANPDWLDLDALLAVELPAHHTEQERTQLLVATVGSAPASGSGAPIVAGSARLVDYTRILDQATKDYFRTSERLASYLSTRDGGPQEAGAAARAQAADYLAKQGASPVRSLIRTRGDLRALVDFALAEQGADGAASRAELNKEIAAREKTLDKLQAEIAEVKSQCARASGAEYNRLADRHNSLVKQHAEELARHGECIARYNAGQATTRSIVEIAGGIDLDPRNFSILTSTTSARLAELKGLAQQASLPGGLAAGTSWLRSQAEKIPQPPVIPLLPTADWQVKLAQGPQNAALTYAQSLAGPGGWGLMKNQDGSWQATLEQTAAKYTDMSFLPAQNKFSLSKIASGRVIEQLIGGVPAMGLIVFEHPKVKEALKPVTKPLKWIQKFF